MKDVLFVSCIPFPIFRNVVVNVVIVVVVVVVVVKKTNQPNDTCAGHINLREKHRAKFPSTTVDYSQGSYGSWKTWKVLEFYCGIFQDFPVLEKGYWSWKVLEIC